MGKSVKQYMTDNPDLRAALGVAPLNDQHNPDSSPPRPTTTSTISIISIRPPSAAALAAASDCIGPYIYRYGSRDRLPRSTLSSTTPLLPIHSLHGIYSSSKCHHIDCSSDFCPSVDLNNLNPSILPCQ